MAEPDVADRHTPKKKLKVQFKDRAKQKLQKEWEDEIDEIQEQRQKLMDKLEQKEAELNQATKTRSTPNKPTRMARMKQVIENQQAQIDKYDQSIKELEDKITQMLNEDDDDDEYDRIDKKLSDEIQQMTKKLEYLKGKIPQPPPIEETLLDDGELQIDEIQKAFQKRQAKNPPPPPPPPIVPPVEVSIVNGRSITHNDRSDVVEEVPFATIRTTDDPSKIFVEVSRYVDGKIDPIDKYDVKLELADLLDQYKKDLDKDKYINKVKEISKKILKKEIAFAKKAKESKEKHGKMMTKEDKLKFLKRI